MLTLDELFDFFWRDYRSTTPDAGRIHALLEGRGERVVNDHVALRTFDIAPLSLARLAEPFVELGYRASGTYAFEDKQLDARSFSHPSGSYPRVFISELRTRRFSPAFQRAVSDLARQVPRGRTGLALLTELPSWPPVTFELYESLLAESEYAAWLSAFGLRVNHFTVSFNALTTFPALASLNDYLEGNGFPLNASGGKVKGTPAALLEQSSTLASRVPWEFAGGERHVVPTCYYEFARRYPDPRTGALYDGFVAASADKLFESTDAKR